MDLASLKGDRSKCLLLEKRNPPCYKLITNRQYLDGEKWKVENDGKTPSDAKIKRWRFGNIDPQKIKKNILIVGETGTGKTTLINSIVTHLLGVTFEDRLWFEITEEEEKSQDKTHTACITEYQLYIDGNQSSYSILDTPGYGDTRGVEEDKQIANHLRKLFSSHEGVQTVNAIGLVVKASVNRLTMQQQYIFNEVMSLFAHNVKNNVVIFFTHSDGSIPKNGLNAIKKAKIPCATDADAEPVYFAFNNALLECNETQPTSVEQKHHARQLKVFEGFWSNRAESIDEFLKFLKKTEDVSLRMTEEVIQNRHSLEACIINLQQRVVKMEEERKALEQIMDGLQKNQEKLDNKENFEFEVDEVIQQLVPIKSTFKKCEELATHCSECKENCHFPGCTWVSKNSLWLCQVMTKEKRGDYRCTVCTNRCPYTNHVKDENMYIMVTRKTKKTADKLRKELQDKHGEDVEIKAQIRESLKLTVIQQAESVDEAYEKIMRLQEIALKKDSPSILMNLDFLITNLIENGKRDKAEKLKEIQYEATQVCTGMEAFYKTLITFVRRT